MATGATPEHLLLELGFSVTSADDGLHGSARVTEPMHVPGTDRLRTSILATWADVITGLLATRLMGPRVPVTLDLDIHLYRPAPSSGRVEAHATTIKAGRSVFVAGVEFHDGDGLFATGAGSFMTAPDASLRLPEMTSIDRAMTGEPTLAVPLAERARCRRTAPGVAVLPRSDDGLNSSNTVNGGLIALVTEEAALSLHDGATLASIGLRYLRPVRVGPVVATAVDRGGLARVELRDEGSGNRIAVHATTRIH